MPALEARDIRKSFGPVLALDAASLSVEHGHVHGLIGPNGSGKSTLLHVIAGRIPCDGGKLLLGDEDIRTWSPTRRARHGLSIKFQLARVYGEQTVRENLLLALQARRSLPSLMLSRTRERLQREADRRLALFGLDGVGDRQAGALSHGEQQWLEIGMAMATEPTVLLLDEPTGGMNRAERTRTGGIIRQAAESCAIVIVRDDDLEFIRALWRPDHGPTSRRYRRLRHASGDRA